jgi:hypothetical protein
MVRLSANETIHADIFKEKLKPYHAFEFLRGLHPVMASQK